MYFVCTCSETCFTGFRGMQAYAAWCKQAGARYTAGTCRSGQWQGWTLPGGQEFFDRPDADTMEETISRFMNVLEAQERGGFNDLHCLLGRLPVPTAKAGQAMTKTRWKAVLSRPWPRRSRSDLHHPNLSCTSIPLNTGTNNFICSAYKEWIGTY